ncbi:GGDEF domain-containing phosphodiesterase [uncultured Psychrosphaera sp.]|uniref:sensor domain-containing protein n=1 Tax=uncultured Psychrosphaera sp. TaxID=1403522 RepID=UPI0030F60321
MDLLNNFFLLSDEETPQGQTPNWRVSSLRIFLVSGLLLCVFVTLQILSIRIDSSIDYAIIIMMSFSVTLITLLFTSYKYYTFTAHSLLLVIVASSILMNLFLTELELAKIGSMYMYSCPIIALMLFGLRTSFIYSVINIIPFYLIIKSINLTTIINITTPIPNSSWYISGLIFLIFNICIPLGTARTIVAAKRLNDSITHANKHLKDKNELYRTFFVESNIAKVIVDVDLRITDFNQLAASFFHFSDNTKTSNKNLTELFPQLVEPIDALSRKLVRLENYHFLISCEKVTDLNYRVFEFIDCSEEQNVKQSLINMEQENRRLKYCDSRTQLPNRDWFEFQCERLREKYSKPFYVVVMQTSNNEYLNLKLNANDVKSLITAAYKRLKYDVQGPLLCSHISSNKLAFVVTDVSAHTLKRQLLVEIKHILDQDYALEDRKFNLSFLFGFAHSDGNLKSSTNIIANAISALKQANINEPFTGYNEQTSNDFVEKYEISMLLDEAIQNAELDVHYQPKVTSTGKCIGLEALARWHSPTLGTVSPDVFIAIAEEYKMISRLTDLIIQKVCAQIAYWSQGTNLTLPVAINISLIDFSQKDFVSKLVKSLADFNVKPQQIELELTETSLDANKDHSLSLMQSLQSWGFTISVDDFGVGYSNIARLAEYPINKLKLDRSLISQITDSPRQKSLVKAVHAMCKELNIKCVAEGVETAEQVNTMAQMGCKEFQGYYFSKPLSAKGFSTHIQTFGYDFTSKKSLTMS